MNTSELYAQYSLKNYGTAPFTIVRGQGTKVWDDAGREYLDFTSGIGVTCLGHSHPAWVAAVQKQAATLVHTSNLYRNPNQALLAQRLVQKTAPGRAFFCNSGTEANEALIKLARLHGAQKSGGEGKSFHVIGAQNAFHGRTFGGMSATPQEKIQKGFRPMLDGFSFGEFNNLASFEKLITPQTAAILIETIQGESGITPATPEFLKGLSALCDKHNLLLLLDEIQCGMGRTGQYFAFQHAGILPDAYSLAKGLASGFPIGAVWISEKHADLFQPGSHGSTFGGNPLACAAALATLDTIDNQNLLQNINDNSRHLYAQLDQLKADFPQKIQAARGLGYMAGIQFTAPPADIITALRDAGILVLPAGQNFIRLLPPLIATKDEITTVTTALRALLSK